MPRPPKNCKYCGAPGLTWARIDGRFQPVMAEGPEAGKLHKCPNLPGKKAEPTPELPVIEVPQASAELWKIVKPAALADKDLKRGETIVTHEIILKGDDGEVERVIEGAHCQVPALIKRIQADVNVFLVGPAGTGKTEGAKSAAEAVELPFYPLSVGPQTSKADLFGYMTATGSYVRTPVREAYEHGGVLLLDEFDAGHAGVITALNAILSNTVVAFPDGVIKKHDKFRCIAAANTFGNGADRQYVGRNQLDAASLNRFAFMIWDYDTSIEDKIAADFPAWVTKVRALRTAASKLKIRAIFSTRQIVMGVKYFRNGIEEKEAITELLRAGISSDDWEKLMQNLPGGKL